MESKFQKLARWQISKLFVALMALFLENIDDSLTIIIESLNSIGDLIVASSFTLNCTIEVHSKSLISVRIPKLALLM